MGNNKVKIFISYARENADVALRLYHDLKSNSIEPWLDTKSIAPGQRWKNAIRQAIKDYDFFLPLFSSAMNAKTGYVQIELNDAIEQLKQISPGKGYIISSAIR
jgi:hypothetical protein